MNDFNYISKEELHMVVCGNIKKHRMQQGLTQQELSERIGISHEYLRQLESNKGQKDFTFYTLYKISIVLNISIDDFLKP
ncbi:helix-turn-helix domain-containing protein [Candidatus Soleaferrea massiliensis]|uniref:helix-turn-helix domain-containing protein n=1 Tax=Candidatus Soleaferrea massiliensis TaxID=1470354 RepID=UPI0012E0524F